MYKVHWQLNGDRCEAIVETQDEANNLCKYLESSGCYHEIFFEDYDDEEQEE